MNFIAIRRHSEHFDVILNEVKDLLADASLRSA